MKLRPSEHLTEEEVQSGLKLVIIDGLAAEGMVAFTGGTFLVAMAVYLGASNFQLGLLAALPTFSSLFQLASIWLVRRYNNRKALTVICNIFARFPLLVIALLPFLFSSGTSLQVLIFLLFFHYFFGSMAGAGWNSWMKDLVPEKQLGTYFSRRSRLTQSLNVIMSLLIAVLLDYIKSHYPDREILAYSVMFLTGGVLGIIGVYTLARTPEPKSVLVNEHMLRLFSRPLKDRNFRNLLIFNSFWAFSLNLATPFLAVYMMKTLGLPLSYIIGLGILNQLTSIAFLRVWGRYADRYSNKNIIGICAPVYVTCILAWAFTGMTSEALTLMLLVLINIFSGLSTAGINLAMSNIGIKLAPREESIVYLSAKNMIIAACSALAPLAGGLMADFFANHQLIWNFQWTGAGGVSMIRLIDLHGWNFFFVIGGTLAMLSLRLLGNVKEKGEVQKNRMVIYMRANIRSKWRENRLLGKRVAAHLAVWK